MLEKYQIKFRELFSGIGITSCTSADFAMTFEEPIEGLEQISPGTIQFASVHLDGLAPEICRKIIVKVHNESKEFPCGDQLKTGSNSYVTNANIVVDADQ